MNKQRKAAAVAFVVALLFVGLELAFDLRTGLAGIFVMGMAGGLIVGDRMTHAPTTPT